MSVTALKYLILILAVAVVFVVVIKIVLHKKIIRQESQGKNSPNIGGNATGNVIGDRKNETNK